MCHAELQFLFPFQNNTIYNYFATQTPITQPNPDSQPFPAPERPLPAMPYNVSPCTVLYCIVLSGDFAVISRNWSEIISTQKVKQKRVITNLSCGQILDPAAPIKHTVTSLAVTMVGS